MHLIKVICISNYTLLTHAYMNRRYFILLIICNQHTLDVLHSETLNSFDLLAGILLRFF